MSTDDLRDDASEGTNSIRQHQTEPMASPNGTPKSPEGDIITPHNHLIRFDDESKVETTNSLGFFPPRASRRNAGAIPVETRSIHDSQSSYGL